MLDLTWMDTLQKENTQDTQKRAVEEQTGQKVYVVLDRNKKAREMALEAHKAYQHNIKTSEALRAEILKGLASGENHAVILEKAIRCIGCMTDDKVFAAQGAKMLKKTAI